MASKAPGQRPGMCFSVAGFLLLLQNMDCAHNGWHRADVSQ